MMYENIALDSIAYELPPEVWSSDDLEAKLGSLYDRLKLPYGRLELMTGIKERRFWPVDFKPSQASALAGKKVLEESKFSSDDIDLLVHSGVCRDRLEPSTAAYVHRLLDLPQSTQIFDVSNACLGFMNAIGIAAAMIDSGQINTALIVSGENGRPLLENTINELTTKELSRNDIKPYFANLTIGAGAAAAIICRQDLAEPDAPRITGGIVETDTSANDLCEGDSPNINSLEMQTDSERLLEAGIALAKRAWPKFLESTGWTSDALNRVITHQVGQRHRTELFNSLEIDFEKDFSSFEKLGNVGSVSVPITLAMAIEDGEIQPNDIVALLGIGSGLSAMMLGIEF